MKSIAFLLVVMSFWAFPAYPVGEGPWRKHIIRAVDEYEPDHVTVHREFSFEAPMEWTGLCKEGVFGGGGTVCAYDGTENWMSAPQFHCDNDGYCVEYSAYVPGSTERFKGMMEAAKDEITLGSSPGHSCTEPRIEHVKSVDLALSAVCDYFEERHTYRGLAKKKSAL